MFDRWRRPIESVNKTWLGAVSIGVVAVVIAAVVGLANLPVSETGYTGEFAQAAQIAPGDRVTIAGIDVGKVDKVKLSGDFVTVAFTVRNGVPVGNEARAAIKLSTLLGRRYLELSPDGDGEPAQRTIKLTHTSVPYNLQQTLADATTTFGDVDADRIATSLSVLSGGLDGVPEALPQALVNINALADIVVKRRDQLGSLLANVDTVTSMVRDQKANLGALMIQGQTLLSEITTRSAAVHRLLDSATATIKTVKTLLNDSPAIDSILDGLTRLTNMVSTNDAMLRDLFQLMPVAFRNLANASGSGTALDVNLPAGVMVDSWMCAISARGKQFNLAQYFTNCKPAADPFPGWPPPDPARLPG
ncbi:MAG: MCE family protein [Mycolicibacterium sp.]|jgi:virulence factor Mce-like protein|nr:MCE family protein [Mycolicibacterium sp.]